MEASEVQLLDDCFVAVEDRCCQFILHPFGKDVVGVIIVKYEMLGVACAGRNDESSRLV